ncbi:MAG: hypothetical protein JW862_18155 [Anaerolineales bacterium]|nr:hypothetical protein [Anaerolineales bacterium]
MDFLGVGPLELFFIILIALIVLGPKDMVKAGRTLGRWMRLVVTSPTWRAMQETSRNLRHLPTKLMREAGVEEIQKEFKDGLAGVNQSGKALSEGLKQDIDRVQADVDLSAWTTMPEPSILPPQTPAETKQPSESAGEDEQGESAHA